MKRGIAASSLSTLVLRMRATYAVPRCSRKLSSVFLGKPASMRSATCLLT